MVTVERRLGKGEGERELQAGRGDSVQARVSASLQLLLRFGLLQWSSYACVNASANVGLITRPQSVTPWQRCPQAHVDVLLTLTQ
jgi:hypothetical protein